jgi:hypothetical protein
LQATAAGALPTPGGPPGRGRAWVQASRLRLQGGPTSSSSSCDHIVPANMKQQQQQGEAIQLARCGSLPLSTTSSKQGASTTTAASARLGEGYAEPQPAAAERSSSNISIASCSSGSSQLHLPSRLGALSRPVPAMDHPLATTQQQQQQGTAGADKLAGVPHIPRASAQLDLSSGPSSPSSSSIRPIRPQQMQGVGFSKSRAGQQRQEVVGVASMHPVGTTTAAGSTAAAAGVGARGAVVTPPRRLEANLPDSPASQSAPTSARSGASYTGAAALPSQSNATLGRSAMAAGLGTSILPTRAAAGGSGDGGGGGPVSPGGSLKQLLVQTTGKAVGGIVPSVVDSIHEVLRSVSPER